MKVYIILGLAILFTTTSASAQIINDKGRVVHASSGKDFSFTDQASVDNAEETALLASNVILGLTEKEYQSTAIYTAPFINSWARRTKNYEIKGEKEMWKLFTSNDIRPKVIYMAALVKTALEHKITSEQAINEKARAFFVDYCLKNKDVNASKDLKKALKQLKKNGYQYVSAG